METTEIEKIGLKIEEEINIDLYNTIPNQNKIAHIYYFLKGHGYKEEDPDIACQKIKNFFHKRNKMNIANLFRTEFQIPFDGSFIKELTLNFQTAVVPSLTITTVSDKVYGLLKPLGVDSLGLSLPIIQDAIKDCYKPHYTENPWKITHSQLFKKIKRNADKTVNIVELEKIFLKMNPEHNAKNQSSDIEKDGDFTGKENGDEESSSTTAHTGNKSSSVGEKDNEKSTSLTNGTKIKESEYFYASSIQVLFDEVHYPSIINADFFENRDLNQCHPLVRNLYNGISNYNLLRVNDDLEDEELELLSVYRESIIMFSNEIMNQYNSNITNQVKAMEKSIEKLEPVEKARPKKIYYKMTK